MAVIRTNSFWDYLGQGIAGFAENTGEMQRRRLLEEQEKRAKTMFGYQTAPYEMAEQIMQDKTPTATILPSLFAAGAGIPVPLPSKFNENQYALAKVAVPGLESPTSRIRRQRRENTEDRLNELKVPKAELEAKQSTAAMGGVDADIQRQRVDQIRPLVEEFANAYVSKQIVAGGGKMSGGRLGNLATLAANAYGEFTRDPERLKSLGVEGVSSDTLRPLFDEAVKKAWDEQQKIDIDKLRANAYMSGQGPADKTPQIMNALTSQARIFESRIREIDETLTDPLKTMMLDPTKVAEMQAKRDQALNIANQLIAGGAALGAGTITVDQAQQLLRDATRLIQAEAPSGPAPTAAPVFEDNAIVAEAQKYGPSRWRAWLQEGVRQNKITQEQANRVLGLLERRKP